MAFKEHEHHLKYPLQLQEEWSGKLAAQRHKLTQELFEVHSQRQQSEEALQKACTSNRCTAEEIREMEHQHRVEVERLQQAAHLSTKKQVCKHSL